MSNSAGSARYTTGVSAVSQVVQAHHWCSGGIQVTERWWWPQAVWTVRVIQWRSSTGHQFVISWCHVSHHSVFHVSLFVCCEPHDHTRSVYNMDHGWFISSLDVETFSLLSCFCCCVSFSLLFYFSVISQILARGSNYELWDFSVALLSAIPLRGFAELWIDLLHSALVICCSQ